MMLTTDSFLHRLTLLQRIELWQRLVPWLNSLLVLLLAYSLAGTAWRLWPQPPISGVLLPSPHSPSSKDLKQTHNLDSVAALHLFGEKGEEVAAPVKTAIDAPETRLSLTLKGIVALSEGGGGRALIAEGSSPEKVYKVGDSLSGGAVLHEVLSDKVILKRGGRFETLTLPRDRVALPGGEVGGRSLASGTSGVSARREASPRRAGRRLLVDPAGGSSASSPPVNRADSISQQLRSLRDDIAADPQQAFDLIQAQPVVENGSVKGYRVSPGKQRRLFHGTGLRAGDVVTSVNGIALSDPAQMATLFQQFKTASSFDLVVERGGRQTNLTVNLGQ